MEVDQLVSYRQELQSRLGQFIANEVSKFVESTGVGVDSLDIKFTYVKYLGSNAVTLNNCEIKVRLDL